MKCEDFQSSGLGLTRENATLDDPEAIEQAAAIEHADHCPRCAALQDSWRDAQAELRELRAATQNVGAPVRVEMRLRQEFQTRHRTMKMRVYAIAAAWTLAGAAVLVGGVNWWNWHLAQGGSTAQNAIQPLRSNTPDASPAGTEMEAVDNSSNDPAGNSTLVAENDAEDFTLLPGSLPQEAGDGAVVRVRLQRGALGALGLPVNEASAGEWIQVDLFVGADGQPQAVRLPQ